jgi:hypothetical protein
MQAFTLQFEQPNKLIGTCCNGYRVELYYKLHKLVKRLGCKYETLTCSEDYTLSNFSAMLANLSKETVMSSISEPLNH